MSVLDQKRLEIETPREHGEIAFGVAGPFGVGPVAVEFDAVFSNLPADATVTYQWTFPGGTATGSSVLVTLPPSSLTITVTAIVTLLGQTLTKSHSLSVTTLSPAEADAFEIT